MLIMKDFQTWLLIGTVTSQSEAISVNTCQLTWNMAYYWYVLPTEFDTDWFNSYPCFPVPRVLWLVVLLAACGVMLATQVKRVMIYLEHPRAVDISVVEQKPMPFPAITFCNENSIR